ncbi:MAG: UDP-glucose/GDP-mannose dehydrogenase family protein [Dethiobacteria bacterium]
MKNGKLKVAIIGTGYVGLTTGLALAYLGHKVTCVDQNVQIIDRLRNNEATIFETGLEELLQETSARMMFIEDLQEIANYPDIIIIAVGTPAKPSGGTDLRYVEEAAREIGKFLIPSPLTIVVNKSTVPIGTARRVDMIIKEELSKREAEADFCVASNPEFLREGTALHDTFYPDRIVAGADDLRAVNLLRRLYAPILEQTFIPPRVIPRPRGYSLPPFLTTSPTSAELTKYAANAFLATKISFINEFAEVAEHVGADINEVARGIGLDKRIGPGFLKAGVGWGGSCFPKDVCSILFTGKKYGLDMPLVSAAVKVNCRQRKKIIEKLGQTLKEIRGSTIGVLGLAFKPDTDDVRGSPAIEIIRELLDLGAVVKVYDPVAMDNYRRSFPEQELIYASSVEETASDSDALLLLTDWDVFLHIPWSEIGAMMRSPVFIDGRNFLPATRMRGWGFTYLGMGC